MQKPESTWLAEDQTDTTGRRRLIVASATLPWVIVLAVVLLPRQTITVDPPRPAEDSRSAASAVASSQTPVTNPAEFPSVIDEPAGVGELVVTEMRGGWRNTPGQRAAGAVATASAYRWLAELEGPPPTDADPRTTPSHRHLVVEAVEQLDDQLAVVTLMSVRANGTSERFGVGVWIDRDHARPAGDPWRLPELTAEVDPFDVEPVDDPLVAQAVHEALIRAGYQDVELHAVERTSSWPWRAHVDAVTPAGDPVDTPVLLRRHLDGYVVAGTVFMPDTDVVDAGGVR